MTEDEPRGVADVDEAFTRALKQFHRPRWVGVAALLAMLCAAVIVLGLLYIQQDARLRASCKFWRTLAPLPVTIVPPGNRPTVTGVSVLAGSRVAYAGQGCGRLPAADPSLIKWASVYRIPMP